MAKLILDDFYCVCCSKCNRAICLPGIAPSEGMLKERGWKYCPFCGDEIDYEKTGAVNTPAS